MWTIDKQFSFCYGHRVWSQKLVGEFCETGDHNCKCRFLHGHEGLVHVFLEANDLERGMVTDFKHLGWLKNFLDDNLDHKFIIDRNDPFFEKIINGKISAIQTAIPDVKNPTQYTITWVDVLRIKNMDTATLIPAPYYPYSDNSTFATVPLKPEEYLMLQNVYSGSECIGTKIDTSKNVEGPEKEFYDGFFIVNFVPTSENLSRWLFYIVQAKMAQLNVKVSKVDWFETPKSRSSYSV